MAFKDVLYSWPWKAEELLEMIEWMRAFNANPAHQRKVKFYGFDMQAPNMAVSNVIAYLRSVDPEYAAKAAELLSGVPLTEADRSLVAGSSNTYQQVVEKIGQVLAHMDALTQDNAEWREARQDALVIQQSMRMMLAGDQGVALRDEAMAANVDWILTQEGSGTKIMLWAHNDHVRTALTEGKIWMGGHLRKRFGVGKPRCLQGLSAALWAAVIAVIDTLVALTRRQNAAGQQYRSVLPTRSTIQGAQVCA